MSRKLCKHRVAVIIETNVPIDKQDALNYVNHVMQIALDNMPIDECVSEPKPGNESTISNKTQFTSSLHSLPRTTVLFALKSWM